MSVFAASEAGGWPKKDVAGRVWDRGDVLPRVAFMCGAGPQISCGHGPLRVVMGGAPGMSRGKKPSRSGRTMLPVVFAESSAAAVAERRRGMTRKRVPLRPVAVGREMTMRFACSMYRSEKKTDAPRRAAGPGGVRAVMRGMARVLS